MDNFQGYIYRWYNRNRRDLPWRNTRNPYKIWISEIILQQTRVAQGTNYYIRFIEAFPTLVALAKANEDDVLKMWQGLGYYSRARNIHATAKIIVESYNSVFPGTYTDIIGLKGIGPYTAAAIASIAFNLAYPTVDGNIYRLLSRYFGITSPIDTTNGKKQFYELAKNLLNKEDPGMHNQAFMEFGALQCTPKSPDCHNCPLCETCSAFQNNSIEQLPVKSKKTNQRKRFFYYYLIESGDSIFIEKRITDDIWKNLYQLPLYESDDELSDKELLAKTISFIKNKTYNIKTITASKKHILSHQVIHARLIHAEVNANVNITKSLIRVNKKDIFKFAVPRLIEQFFEDFNLVNQ